MDNPPIVTAAARLDFGEVDRLLTAGADVNGASPTSGVTALMTATMECNPRLIERLLAAGANVNQRDIHGRTALHKVFVHDKSTKQKIRTLKALLKAPGIDLNVSSNVGNSPLDWALDYVNPNIEIAKVLLEAGADVNAPSAYDGSLPLERLISNVEYLEERGGEQNMKLVRKLKKIAPLLLEHGARVRDLSRLSRLGIRPKPIVSSLASAAFKRRMHAVSAWNAAQRALYPEAYEGAAAAAPENAGNAGAVGGAGAAPASPIPRENGTGANHGGARRRSMKKRKAAKKTRRHRRRNNV